MSASDRDECAHPFHYSSSHSISLSYISPASSPPATSHPDPATAPSSSHHPLHSHSHFALPQVPHSETPAAETQESQAVIACPAASAYQEEEAAYRAVIAYQAASAAYQAESPETHLAEAGTEVEEVR